VGAVVLVEGISDRRAVSSDPAEKRASVLYTRGTLTTEYVVVGVGGVVNRALIA
jgi:hypothetical protein